MASVHNGAVSDGVPPLRRGAFSYVQPGLISGQCDFTCQSTPRRGASICTLPSRPSLSLVPEFTLHVCHRFHSVLHLPTNFIPNAGQVLSLPGASMYHLSGVTSLWS